MLAHIRTENIGSGTCRDGDLEHAAALLAEQLVGSLDVIELEVVRDHRPQIDPTGGDDFRQSRIRSLPPGLASLLLAILLPTGFPRRRLPSASTFFR
jgi:hypothetical protein